MAALNSISFALDQIMHVPKWTKGGDQSMWTFKFLFSLFVICAVCLIWFTNVIPLYCYTAQNCMWYVSSSLFLTYAPLSYFPSYTQPKWFGFNVLYVSCFSHFVQTLCIYVWLEAFLESGSSPCIFRAFVPWSTLNRKQGNFRKTWLVLKMT